MNRARSRAAVGTRSSTLPLLSLQLLDESDGIDDSGESTSVCESSKPEASSSSSTSDGSSDEAGGDDDPHGTKTLSHKVISLKLDSTSPVSCTGQEFEITRHNIDIVKDTVHEQKINSY